MGGNEKWLMTPRKTIHPIWSPLFGNAQVHSRKFPEHQQYLLPNYSAHPVKCEERSAECGRRLLRHSYSFNLSIILTRQCVQLTGALRKRTSVDFTSAYQDSKTARLSPAYSSCIPRKTWDKNNVGSEEKKRKKKKKKHLGELKAVFSSLAS